MWGSRARLALTCGVEALGTWRLALITHRGDLSCPVVVRNAGRCSLNSRLYSGQMVDPAKCRLHKRENVLTVDQLLSSRSQRN